MLVLHDKLHILGNEAHPGRVLQQQNDDLEEREPPSLRKIAKMILPKQHDTKAVVYRNIQFYKVIYDLKKINLSVLNRF